MTEEQIIRRKIRLKTQALKVIRTERAELRHYVNLLSLRDFLQKKIRKDFDAELSGQLDAVELLLNSFVENAQKMEAFSGRN